MQAAAAILNNARPVAAGMYTSAVCRAPWIYCRPTRR
jgi:hypothetical protein